LLAIFVLVACSATSPDSGGTLVASDGARLAYSIDYPSGSGPFPAVVLVHGSGRVTRADHVGLSARFTSHGWAVLRYDKRGVGESQGTYSGVGVANSDTLIPLLGRDAAAAWKRLAESERIDISRVGFAGGSQAGWIIPVAISVTPNAAFGVMLSGPTVSVGSEIYFSSFAENTALPLDDAYEQLQSFSGPEGFDPGPYLATMTPTLWLFGSEDRSIPTRVCVERLNATASPAATYKVFPGLDHALSGDVWNDVYGFLDRFTAPGSR
jgi:pimeloyl-ACP methyl ester carboxylesterase